MKIAAVVTFCKFLFFRVMCSFSEGAHNPSRFLCGMKWLDAGTCVVPESGPSSLWEPDLSELTHRVEDCIQHVLHICSKYMMYLLTILIHYLLFYSYINTIYKIICNYTVVHLCSNTKLPRENIYLVIDYRSLMQYEA